MFATVIKLVILLKKDIIEGEDNDNFVKKPLKIFVRNCGESQVYIIYLCCARREVAFTE